MGKYLKIIIILLHFIIVSERLYGSNDCTAWMTSYNVTVLDGITCGLYYDDGSYCANRYIGHDLAGGIKESCRTLFPSAGERMIIRRQGDQIENVSYLVQRDYCWWRNSLDDKNCSFLSYSTWGDGYSATFAPTDVYDISSDYGTKSLSNGSNDGHRVCVKRVPPGSGFATGGTNTSKKNKICAYVVNALAGEACNSYLIDAKYALIGCVDEPFPSGPPTWNVVYNSGFAPYVDSSIKLNDYTDSKGINIAGYLSYGSTFDKPMVILTHGLGVGDQLELRYDYNTGDKGCSKFPSGNNDTVSYCAIPNMNDPSQVCACLDGINCDTNSYIGCAPRPNLAQSNLKIIAKYQQYEYKSTDGSTIQSYPGVSPQFVRTDSADNAQYKKDSSGNILKDADGNSIYDTLPLPEPALAIREYYTGFIGSTGYYIRDSGSVYGIKFEAMIPKLDAKGQPSSTWLITPYTRALTDGCGAIGISNSLNDPNAAKFFTPDGTRERSYCTICTPGCPIPSPTPCNDGNTISHNNKALEIYCPGELSAVDFAVGGANICLSDASGWDFMSSHDQLCTPIPSSCEAIDSPSIGSGLSIWPKLKPLDPAIDGTCDSAYGVVKRIDYSLSGMLSSADFYKQYYGSNNSTSPDPNIYASYQNTYGYATNTLNSLAVVEHGRNLNLSPADIAQVKTALGSFSSYHTIVKTDKTPTRTCSATSQSVILNGCVNASLCGAITKPSVKDGYANWSENIVDPNNLKADTWTTFLVKGSCTAPYQQVNSSSPPQRYCVAQIDQNKNFVYYYWDNAITDQCVLQNP